MSHVSTEHVMPRVVHIKREPYDVRIDRQTHWGNPFVIGKDGTREQVIAKYREWILSEPSIVAMAKRTLKGKTLGCWCAPKACHGDVLLEIANGCYCDVPQPPSYPLCDGFNDSDLGTCTNCGHEKACHDNP